MNAPAFPSNVHRSDMLPISVRIPRQQHNRLKAQRSVDGISVQEHMRRAVSHYIDLLSSGGRTPQTPIQAQPPPAVANTPEPVAKSKTRTSRKPLKPKVRKR